MTVPLLVLRSQLLSWGNCVAALVLQHKHNSLWGFMAPERDGQPISRSLKLQLTGLAGFCSLSPSKVFILLKDPLSPLGPQAGCFSLHLLEHLDRCLQPWWASPSSLPSRLPLCFFSTQLTSHKTETNMQKALCVLIRFGGKYV